MKDDNCTLFFGNHLFGSDSVRLEGGRTIPEVAGVTDLVDDVDQCTDTAASACEAGIVRPRSPHEVIRKIRTTAATSADPILIWTAPG